MQRPKFQVQQKVQDFTSKIRYVVDNTTCKKHGAHRHGQPCWWLPSDGIGLRAAICDKRARQVYTGTPSHRASTSKFQQKKEKNAA